MGSSLSRASHNAAPSPRRTRRSVHLWDRASGVLITVGGQGVIVAVLGICVYLAISVLPLFQPGSAKPRDTFRTAIADPLWTQVDEYRASFLALGHDGVLALIHLPTGTLIDRKEIVPPGRTITAWSRDPATGLTALGYDDGTVQLGTVTFRSELPLPASVPSGAESIDPGSSMPLEPQAEQWGGVLERLGRDQFREIRPWVDLQDPVALQTGSGEVTLIDYRARASDEYLVAMRADGTATFQTVRITRPLGGGRPRVRLNTYPLPLESPEERSPPERIFVTGDGSSVLALWDDGFVQRYATRRPSEVPIVLAESGRLLGEGRRVTAASMLLGGLTLIVGDDAGSLLAAFAAVDPGSRTVDGHRLVVGHRFQVGREPIQRISASPRDRSIIVGDGSGRVVVRHVTSEKIVVELKDALSDAVAAVELAPKLDGILALGRGGTYRFFELNARHPEVSFRSLFGSVQYEGLASPQHVYQSSAAEDAAEIKLGLVPLIVGTLKATVFAMLFATPIAVLAAIYTSEFLHPNLRAVIKPGVEMMASLPSVVLGFVAAIIVAPYMAEIVPAVLVGLVVVPVGVLLGAHLWQMAPVHMVAGISSWRRLGMIVAVLAASVGTAGLLGPFVEDLLFTPTRHDVLIAGGAWEPVPEEQWPAWVGGRATMSPDEERRLRLAGMSFRDSTVVRPVEPQETAQRAKVEAAAAAVGMTRPSLRRWLDGNIGGPWPGWFLLMHPVGAVVASVVLSRGLGRRFGEAMAGRAPLEAAVWQFGKFILALAGMIVLAWLGASLLTALRLDPRDVLFGSFSQRNTLVVGLIMGFAVIPIIYTISEDAMQSVPASLRSAALGAGATPWQTALSVVLPVAASGIFSACMIGLGRAVGETMIVVMATGNTPSMDWNIFSGFRTLSANIAVELPEAPRDTTHYRVLFLCGLVLFAMTFLINTTAEMVRQRFRRRSASL